MRLVDVLTQNPVQAGDSLIRSSKSRELVRFPFIGMRSLALMNWVKRSELTVGMPQLFFTR